MHKEAEKTMMQIGFSRISVGNYYPALYRTDRNTLTCNIMVTVGTGAHLYEEEIVGILRVQWELS